MQLSGYTVGLGALIALLVLIVSFIFIVFGAPSSHVDDWIFGLIAALAVARLVP
jgi:hypothetical protein